MLGTMLRTCCFRTGTSRRSLLPSIFTAGALAFATTAKAQYEENFWDRIEVTPSVTGSVTYDTNVGGRSAEAEDVMLMASGNVGLIHPFRYARLGVDITAVAARFMEYDSLDYEDIYLGWIIDTSESAGTRRLRYSVGFDVQEDTGTNDALQGRVKERSYRANGSISYLLSRQTSVGVSANWNKRDPRGSVLRYEPAIDDFVETRSAVGSERTGYSAFADWEQSRRLSWRLSANYSETEFDEERFGRGDFETYGADLRVRGELTSKLSGTLSAGVDRRKRDDGDETTSPTFSAGLNYNINERTSANLTATKRFSAALDGSDSDQTNLSLNLQRSLSYRMSLVTGLSWVYSDFEGIVIEGEDPDDYRTRGRHTSRLTGTVGLSRAIGTWGSGQLSVSWTEYNSNYGTGDYDRLRMTLALTARF